MVLYKGRSIRNVHNAILILKYYYSFVYYTEMHFSIITSISFWISCFPLVFFYSLLWSAFCRFYRVNVYASILSILYAVVNLERQIVTETSLMKKKNEVLSPKVHITFCIILHNTIVYCMWLQPFFFSGNF